MMILSLLIAFSFANDPFTDLEQACITKLGQDKIKEYRKVCACLKRNYKRDVSSDGAKMIALQYKGESLGDYPQAVEGAEAIFDFAKDIENECLKNPAYVNPPEGPPKKHNKNKKK